MESAELPLEISCEEVNTLRKSEEPIFLLDCREQDEHDLVSLPFAELIPMSALPDRVTELEPQRERHVVVFCHHGGRSARVAVWLRNQHGFSQVQSMAGGIDAWAEQIDPSLPRY